MGNMHNMQMPPREGYGDSFNMMPAQNSQSNAAYFQAFARADFARVSQERIENERLMLYRVREAQARAFFGMPPFV